MPRTKPEPKTTAESAAKKRPATKKPATKKPAAKKPAAKRPAPNRPGLEKLAPRKPGTKKTAKRSTAKPPRTKPSAGAQQTIAPLFLVEPHAPGADFSLCLADAHSPIELFEEEGHSGNGYAWGSVARVALADLGIDEESIRFDSEAGTFVAISPSREEVEALGRALAALLRDEEALRRAIRAVPEDDWDD
jgi:hypothetical protein